MVAPALVAVDVPAGTDHVVTSLREARYQFEPVVQGQAPRGQQQRDRVVARVAARRQYCGERPHRRGDQRRYTAVTVIGRASA